MFHYGILLPADNIHFNEEGEVVRSQIFGWALAKAFLGSPETLFLRFHCAVYHVTMAKSQALQSRLFLLKQTPNSPVQN